ncbi:MAG: T9SS type A sorting domain-containing protein [Ignavibacteriales bacterium]|nr:T9SS type A sorting domain-containing protein [Ignavibacteriales bacterium]
MDFTTYEDGVVIVYQEEDYAPVHNSVIKARCITNGVVRSPLLVFEDSCPETYDSWDYQPVIGIAYGNKGIVVLKGGKTDGYTGQFFSVPVQFTNNTLSLLYCEVALPHMGPLSFTPTISANKTISANPDSFNFHLAWCQWSDAQGTNKNIYFMPLKIDPNDNTVVVDEQKYCNVSGRNTNLKHIKPSITSVKNSGSNLASARVVWRTSQWDAVDSAGSVMFSDPLNTSRYWYFGSRINSPTITLENDNKYFIGWADVSGGTTQNYWVDNSLSSFLVKCIGNLNTRDVQLTGMSNKTTARAIGLSGTTAPYSFAVKPLQTGNAVATEGTIVTTAIEGTVNYPDAGGVSFNYKLGDISVDGEPISFVEADPLIIFRTVEDMNQYLVSQPFTLNDRSEFFYSIECLPVQPEYVEALFQDGSSLSFTVQLVDASTEEIIGTYDNVMFDATHTSDYRNIMFDVDCNGIGDRTVKLRLQITNTAVGGEVVQGSFIVPLPEGQTAKMLSKVKEDRISFWRNNGAVAKKTATIKKVAFNGKAIKGSGADAVITEYALDQNYPNPFNPATTINYQLPKAGLVTLKIYDMLGKEVKVLVSEHKESGKYTAEFNGAGLASGVYVYRLDCNDFHATKKLTLLK